MAFKILVKPLLEDWWYEELRVRGVTRVSEGDLNSPHPPGIWRRPAVASARPIHLATA